MFGSKADLSYFLFRSRAAFRTIRAPCYKAKALPTDTDVPVFVEKVFSQFYRDMFRKTVGCAGVIVMEYAWDMS